MSTTLTTQLVTTNGYNQLLQLVTTDYCTMICIYVGLKKWKPLELTYGRLFNTLESEHIGYNKWKALLGKTYLTRVYFSTKLDTKTGSYKLLK